MLETWTRIYGEVDPWPSMSQMESILRAAGLEVYVGRYSIVVKDCESFSFEEYGGDLGDPCIVADAETADVAIRDAKLVSDALTKAGVRHCFSVEDEHQRLLAYLHHDWPRPSGPYR